jgi:hypothetical protein
MCKKEKEKEKNSLETYVSANLPLLLHQICRDIPCEHRCRVPGVQ